MLVSFHSYKEYSRREFIFEIMLHISPYPQVLSSDRWRSSTCIPSTDMSSFTCQYTAYKRVVHCSLLPIYFLVISWVVNLFCASFYDCHHWCATQKTPILCFPNDLRFNTWSLHLGYQHVTKDTRKTKMEMPLHLGNNRLVENNGLCWDKSNFTSITNGYTYFWV